MNKIPFNKPYLTGKEMHYIYQAVYSGKISGNGMFTQKCQKFFEENYGFQKALLTTSCTDALEMTALLMNIESGDEVIVPSYTFVSSALAYVRQGAKIIFADSRVDHPGMDENKVEKLVTNKTRAIVVVHYAGVACDMDKIMDIAEKYNLFVVEDAAQAINSYYNKQALGSIGHFGAFSFHETKNINAGEGGLLAINNKRFVRRAEIIWEKGTNRAEFFRGEVNKYGWVDIGSSFLPSDTIAAYLYAQIEHLEEIQTRRKAIWNKYYKGLKPLEDDGKVRLPFLPDYATNNGHMFYILCSNLKERDELIHYLKNNNIQAIFHYLALHKSPYYSGKHDVPSLPNSIMYTDRLMRLPFYFELADKKIKEIVDTIKNFFSLQA